MNRQLFSPEDQALLEKLEYKPHSKPSFSAMRGYLEWSDEREPIGISADGAMRYRDLLMARAVLFHGRQGTGLQSRQYYQEIWKLAVESALKWPGFQRTTLSKEEAEYLAQSNAELLTSPY